MVINMAYFNDNISKTNRKLFGIFLLDLNHLITVTFHNNIIIIIIIIYIIVHEN